jgi:hypothetical protein
MLWKLLKRKMPLMIKKSVILFYTEPISKQKLGISSNRAEMRSQFIGDEMFF